MLSTQPHLCFHSYFTMNSTQQSDLQPFADSDPMSSQPVMTFTGGKKVTGTELLTPVLLLGIHSVSAWPEYSAQRAHPALASAGGRCNDPPSFSTLSVCLIGVTRALWKRWKALEASGTKSASDLCEPRAHLLCGLPTSAPRNACLSGLGSRTPDSPFLPRFSLLACLHASRK